MKTIRDILTLSFFLFFVGITTHAQGTYTVGAGGNFTTLAAAIASATVTSGSTLELLDNQTCNNITVSKNLTIKKSPSLPGDVLLNYNGTVRHFTVNTNTSVTFENLVFVGPNATYSGGDFTFNGTTTSGGGINSSQATSLITLNNCKVGGCATTSTGGAINTAGSLAINNSSINYNRGTSGGGISCTGSSLTINNSTINNNTGTSTGGGIYSNKTLTLIGDVVCNNNIGTSGGGIYKTGSTIATALTSLTITNNIATTGPGGGFYAGAVLDLSAATITTINISNNAATTYGGGIYATAALTLNNATISGNTTSINGGGIWISTAGLTLQNSIVSDNIAGNHGGGIYTATAAVTCFLRAGNATFSNNKAGWDFNANDYSTNPYSGGAIYASGQLSLDGEITIQDNTATYSGGAIYKNSGGTAFDVTQVKQLNIAGNTAKKGDGGAIYSPFDLTFINLTNGTIDNNKAEVGSGGAIYTTGAFSILSATISNNSSALLGGALYTNGQLDVSNTTFTRNTADSIGGAIYKGTIATMNIVKSTFHNNRARINGGAIISDLNSATTNVQNIGNCTFTGNTAANNGGAIYFSNKTKNVSIYYCTINNNTTTNNTANAIYSGTDGMVLNGNIIYGNGTGNDTEIANATNIVAQYNIIRDQTFTGATNKKVNTGSGADIFASVDGANNDIGLLDDNGGPTQTILIKQGGLADATIPLSTSLGFGTYAPVDQRSINRTVTSTTDMGSVQITTATCLDSRSNPIVWYVDLNAASPGDGTDIDHPANSLYLVLENACLLTGDTIKMAKGTYYATNTDPGNSFLIKKGITLLGGYSSTFNETERNIVTNLTILDGNAKSYHVVFFILNSNESGTIDGVTIQNGRANSTTGASGCGGGIYINNGSITVSNTTITNNTSMDAGGGIYITPEAALIVKNSTLSNNKAGYNSTTSVFDKTTTALTPSGLMVRSGGGICALGNLEMQGSMLFDSNEAGANGGGIIKGNQNDFITNRLDTLTIINCKSWTNPSGVNSTNGNLGGGGIYTMVNLDLFDVKQLTLKNCIAQAQGGGIFVNNKTVGFVEIKVANLFADGCQAVGVAGVGIGGAGSDGGALESFSDTGSRITVKDSYFQNCYAGRYGGAMGIGNALALQGKIVIDNSTAVSNGGGISQWGISGGTPVLFDTSQLDTLIITNCKTTGTTGSFGGGAIWVQKDNCDLSSVKYLRIENNYSRTNGGGICMYGGSAILTLKNAILINNKAGYTGTVYNGTYNGGGIYNNNVSSNLQGKITLDGNAAAYSGGGFYQNGGTVDASKLDTLIITNCRADGASGGGINTNAALDFSYLKYGNISGNYAKADGAGIYTSNNLSIIYANISNNTTVKNGGGIWAGNALTVKNCTFSQNTALAGGAIYTNSTAAKTVLNSTFNLNAATNTDTGGGAIYSSPINDAIRVAFSTFTGNTTAGNVANAIYFNNTTNKVLNGNIIYSNGTGTEINTIPTTTASYNIIRSDIPLGGTNNMTLGDGELSNIFTTGTLSDNGGKTPTLMIKQGGYAQNYIPKTAVDSWSSIFGSIVTDQRDSSRIEKFADVGAIELRSNQPMVVNLLKGGACINTPIDLKTLVAPTSTNVRDTFYFNGASYIKNTIIPSVTTPYSNQAKMRFVSNENIVLDTIVPYYVFDTQSTWAPKNATTTDWNDAANWNKGIPGPCTYVTIPGGVSSYPVLQQGTDSYMQPVCDTIDFKFGGEVARTDYLNYNGSKVYLTLNGNRWYMFSPPLRSMFPGDLYVNNPNPVKQVNPYTPGYGLYSYAKLFSQTNPQTGKNLESEWTGTFNTPDITLNSGFGFAIWVDDGTDINTHFQTTFGFPKHDAQVNYYTPGSGDIESTIPINRNNKENRFIYESVINTTTGDISLVSNASGAGKLAIVGNPFMTHLNFNDFYAKNSQFIDNEYKVLLADGNYATYKIGLSNAFALDNLIAPMQSIIVSTIAPFSNLTTNVTQTAIKAGAAGLLRATTEEERNSNSLTIQASIGNLQNKTLIVSDAGAVNSYQSQKDSRKLFGKAFNRDLLTVYTRSSDGFALDINSFGQTERNIPIGIWTNKKGDITLSFDGLSNFMKGYDVILLDAQAGKATNLRESTQYTFTNNTVNEYIDNRFSLSFVPTKTPTAIDALSESTVSGISVALYEKTMHVFSTDGSNLQTFQLFDIQGRLLYTKQYLNEISFSYDIKSRGIYIVKVRSQKSLLTQKVMVK